MKKLIELSILLVIILILFISFNGKNSNKSKERFLGDIGDGILLNSNVVNFSSYSMASKNVQNAVDELYSSYDDGCQIYYAKSSTSGGKYTCTKRTEATSQNNILDATDVHYDNTSSGLEAIDVGAAIEELTDLLPSCKDGFTQANITSTTYDCKRECGAPVDIVVGTNGTVSWSGMGATTYLACIVTGENTCTPSTAITNGAVYSAITSEIGSRTIFIKGTCDSTYTDSESETEQVTVNVDSVELSSNSPGVTAVSGVGNYIEGASVTISATLKNGYTWDGWLDDEEELISDQTSYTGTIEDNWIYTANATPNEYTLNYSDNLFAATSQVANGVTATYDENGSYLTLNGTGTTTDFISNLWNLERRSFNSGDQYQITINYISGSYSLSDSNALIYFVMELTNNGNKLSDRDTSPVSYANVTLPSSGSNSTTYTIDSSRTSANGLQYWLWQSVANNTTFNNYKVQILITKVQSRTIIFDETYGELPTPTKTGHTFLGWYTAMTGGTQVLSTSTYETAGNQTLYARYSSHKLNLQYNGNGSEVTWCGNNDTYDMDSSKFAIKQSNSSTTISTIPYGQYIDYTNGLLNYHYTSGICFDYGSVPAVSGYEWVLNNDSTKKYNQNTTTYTAESIANDAGCDLVNSDNCTVRMDVNWKQANPMTLVVEQNWHPIVESTDQDYTFIGASNAQGAVTYTISSQTPGNYFSISNSSNNTITMSSSATAGHYTIEITVTAAGNSDYLAKTSTITLNVAVGATRCNPPTSVAVSIGNAVTWTASSNCSGATYKACVVTGTGTCVPTTTLTSGSTYNDITFESGTRKVCIMTVAPSDYYGDSTLACVSKNVYNVTLTKGTGIATVTGAGNYIEGATVTLGATMNSGYAWSKWIQTSGGTDVSTTKAYSAVISSNWAYTAVAVGNTYTLNYSDNLFAGMTQVENGVTATYSGESGNYLTLNGTVTASSFVPSLWNNERRTINSGDVYRVTLNYVSGTIKCGSADCSGTERPRFVLELTTSGSRFSDRTTDPKTYKTYYFPTSGSTSADYTVDSTRASANGLQYWLYQSGSNFATFTDYKVQVIITKVHSKSVTYGSAVGSLNTPTKTGYDFDGWYTAISGGTKITSTTIYDTVGNSTVYARWIPHKLYIQYNGNGSAVTWCANDSSSYSMDSSKYAILQSNSSRNVTVRAYGQYISPTGGLVNYNNAAAVCFAKEGYTAKTSAHWFLSTDTSKTYDHGDATLTAYGMANDAGCNLKTTSECTILLKVNWKSANPIKVTASQSWSATFSTSAQTHSFTAATNAQGSVTYAIQSQPSGNYFSIPTNSTASVKMKASTPAGTYSVKIRATAAGNANYISGYKDITLTVTVAKATPTITLSASSGKNCKGGKVTYTVKSNVAGTFKFTSSNTSNATVSPSSKSASANTEYTVTVTGKASAAATITNSFTPTSSNYKATSKTFTLSQGKWKGTGAGNTGNSCSTAGYASCTDSGKGINFCCMNNCQYPGKIMTSSCTCVAA